MPTQILATKLYIPVLRPDVVPRSRLIDRLNAGQRGKLTLVSAPAGFGKTTLISEWLASGERSVAWISLDEADSDPAGFLTYVVAALQMIAPDIGANILNLLKSPQSPPIASLLTPLVNELATLPADFVLVLDDYHMLDDQEIDSALSFLIDNQPPQMHLVITTREDPRLPLARLRARGQLTELRAADLRFTVDEAAEFLNQVMGLSLVAEDVAALEARTEGWIAGIQLAAISMQGLGDKSGFIQSFTGSHHFVLDYLVEEVLNRQPAHIQRFLLKTSILDRMSAALCDALLQDEVHAAEDTLEHIRQANLFVIPLDNDRRWYRYHHLFGDLLQKRLQTSGEDVRELHVRASAWYEANGFEIEAFHHAAIAGDIDRAERLIEGGGTPLYLRGAAKLVSKWLATLPIATFDHNPSLWVTYATVLTVSGQQITTVEDKLHAAETVLDDLSSDDYNRDLRGRIAMIRGMLAGPRYDIETMRLQSALALELLNPDNVSLRMLALWTNGLAHQHRGEHDIARQIYTETVTASELSGNTMMTIAALTCLGQVQEAGQQFEPARQSYERVLELVGDPLWPTACEACLGLARVHWVKNDGDQAEKYARQGLALGQQIENVDTPIECGILLAKVQIARGDFDTAESTLAQSERLIEQRGFADKLPQIRAEQARIQQFRSQGGQSQSPQLLIDPLSERELEVLRLIAEGLTNREIGERLFLALDTIKGHNRRIFAKLGVQRRTEAIVRASELGLI